jgi:hypothetical protein
MKKKPSFAAWMRYFFPLGTDSRNDSKIIKKCLKDQKQH